MEYAKRREYDIAYSRAWRAANKEKKRETNAKWRARNRGVINALKAKRRAAKLQRTPVWSEKGHIKALYAAAARMTKCTGIEWHVDHILPLRGEEVSGLHVLGNLQIITAAQNLAKNNKWIAEHALDTVT